MSDAARKAKLSVDRNRRRDRAARIKQAKVRSKNAMTMLKTELDVSTFAEVLKEIGDRPIGAKFIRASKKSYLKALSLALALYYATAAESEHAARLAQLDARSGYKRTTNTPPELTVIRSVIDYGEGDERKANRAAASRDAAALRYLVEQQVQPGEVVTRGLEAGEGPEIWARRLRAVRTRTHSNPSVDARSQNSDAVRVRSRHPESSYALMDGIDTFWTKTAAVTYKNGYAMALLLMPNLPPKATKAQIASEVRKAVEQLLKPIAR